MFSTWAWRYPNGVLSLTYFSKWAWINRAIYNTNIIYGKW
jgi:hypothetical protein